MNTGGFDFNEENFLKLEQVLAAQRPKTDDLWPHRVSLFCHMAGPAYAPKGEKFKFGLLSYSVWLLSRILTVKPERHAEAPPAADFLVHIVAFIVLYEKIIIPGTGISLAIFKYQCIVISTSHIAAAFLVKA